VPEVTVTAQGKQKRVHRWYATPWEILRQLPGLAGYLRAEASVDQLQQTSAAKSDTQAALEMREAKRQLFARFQHKKEERVNETGEGRGNDGRVENEENQTQERRPLRRIASPPAFRLILQ